MADVDKACLEARGNGNRNGWSDLLTAPRADRSMAGEWRSPFESEMNHLYQAIDALLSDIPRKVIQFMGARDGEGTSSIVREFAMVAAGRLGRSVLVLDLPDVVGLSAFRNDSPMDGWENVLRGLVPMESVFRRVGDSRLYAGTAPRYGTDAFRLAYSSSFEEFREWARQRFDLVLIDSPSASASPDGIALSRRVDGVVLVLEAERTRWPLAENLKNRILLNGGRILGIAFNKRRHHIPKFLYRQLLNRPSR